METGDIVLFKSVTCCACCVGCFTRSTTNHVAIILHDIQIDNLQLNGLYVLQSGMEYVKNTEGKFALGVQIHKLSDLATSYPLVYFRHLKVKRDEAFMRKIADFWREIKDAPYDLSLATWSRLTEIVLFRPIGENELKNTATIEEKIKQLNFEIECEKKSNEQKAIVRQQLEAMQHEEGFTCSALLAYLLIKLELLSFDNFAYGWKSVTPRFFDELKKDWLTSAERINLLKL